MSSFDLISCKSNAVERENEELAVETQTNRDQHALTPSVAQTDAVVSVALCAVAWEAALATKSSWPASVHAHAVGLRRVCGAPGG